VVDEMGWRQKYGSRANLKPLLESVLHQTAKNLVLIQAKVERHGRNDTIGLVDLCRMLLPAYLRSNMYAAACIGFRQKYSRFLMFFRTAVTSAWSNSEVGRATTDVFSYICKQSEHHTEWHRLSQSVQWQLL
jgi:hypothetical protein